MLTSPHVKKPIALRFAIKIVGVAAAARIV
jgi:hypothetical protein